MLSRNIFLPLPVQQHDLTTARLHRPPRDFLSEGDELCHDAYTQARNHNDLDTHRFRRLPVSSYDVRYLL